MVYLENFFICLLLNVLVFSTCIQHKADVVVLPILLLPCCFPNFFLAAFSFFIKWLCMRSFIFLFILNAVIGLLANTLGNSGLICRMCQFFYLTSDRFGSVNLYINSSSIAVCFLAVIFFIILQKLSLLNWLNLLHLSIQIISIIFSSQKSLFHNCAVFLVLILRRTNSF